MDAAAVVTCFLRNRGEVLLLHRADDAETYAGRWGTVTGYVENDDPGATARAEIEEETDLDEEAITLAREGEPFDVIDEDLGRRWVVHPFLFDTTTRRLTLNEESQAAEWTIPTAIRRRETVPDLWRLYAAIAPSVETVASDAEHGSATLSVRALEVLRNVAGMAALDDTGMASVVETAEALLEARPGMAAVSNRVNRAMHGATSADEVERAAAEGIERALDADEEAAEAAVGIVDSWTVVTLSRSGTVRSARPGGETDHRGRIPAGP